MHTEQRDESPSFRRPKPIVRVPMDSNNMLLNGLPKGKGKLYCVNGDVKIVNGPFDDLNHLYDLLACSMIQMVPCTIGSLNRVAVLIMDEEGMGTKEVNELATKNMGEQVFGHTLYGNILLLHSEDFK
jgi:hypothetical protein